ncbi:hypothetical protein CDAR_278551 [Caerostris darwini]|uniref:Uncharacterized protein n=1 Tax=Caerostris darwini TaxID=1538125 RepID=A0AAV4WP81_9ARAC|nr:hypothetical protein CDAR_278551 [Caerostris darwini]
MSIHFREEPFASQSLIDLSIAISTCYTNGRSAKPRPVPSTWSAKTLPTRPMSARFPTRVSIAHRTKMRHASMTPKGWARSNSLPPFTQLHTSRFRKKKKTRVVNSSNSKIIY